MNSWFLQIDKESEAAVHSLTAAAIQSVLSPACDVWAGRSDVVVKHAYIQIAEEQFISVETDWLRSTDRCGLHQHELLIRCVRTPGSIFYEPHRRPGGFNFKQDHMTLHLGARRKVIKVDVLMAKEEDEGESSTYDAGLLLTREDGSMLAVVREESIAGWMHLAHTPDMIRQVSEGLVVRQSFSAES